MTRAFAPPKFTLPTDFHVKAIESVLGHSGEYVKHIPASTAEQFVVMKYQYMPVEAGIAPDFALNATHPTLRGHIDHFETPVENYAKGDAVQPAKGSRFEIRGFEYIVKKINVKHTGSLYIELAPDHKCQEARPEFFIEVETFLCPVPPCDESDGTTTDIPTVVNVGGCEC